MRTLKRGIAVMLIAGSIIGGGLVRAQEATPEATAAGTIVCDSDLLLSLYTAEHFFGFSQIMSTIPNPDPTVIADVSKLDRGQYTPLFNALTNPLPIVSMSPEQIQAFTTMMTMDTTAMDAQLVSMMPAGTDMSTFTGLNNATIAGEDPTCTVLRKELNRFYIILNLQHMQDPNTSGAAGTVPTTGSGGTSTTATPASAIGGSNSTGSSVSGNGGASNSGGNTSGSGAQNTPPPGGGSPGG